jgi:hypothetical protein
MIDMVMIGGMESSVHEHFIDKIRKIRGPENTPTMGALQMARKRLDAGFHLSRDEYFDAIYEFGMEMKAQIKAVNLVREENEELRTQVGALKGALEKARDTLGEQDKVIRSLVRPSGIRSSSMS